MGLFRGGNRRGRKRLIFGNYPGKPAIGPDRSGGSRLPQRLQCREQRGDVHRVTLRGEPGELFHPGREQPGSPDKILPPEVVEGHGDLD